MNRASTLIAAFILLLFMGVSLQAQPLARYTFDDGTANDITGNGMDGVLLGDAEIAAQDDPSAATARSWKQWRIPLSAYADQGIDLTNVDKIAIGLGSKAGAASPGGSGTLYIDDIRLYRP